MRLRNLRNLISWLIHVISSFPFLSDVSTPSSSERNSCWLTISSSSIAEAFGLERGTLPSEGADGTAQSGLSLRVFNDAPEHREQSVTALFDSLTLRPPIVKCNWEKMPAQRWHKAMRGSYNDSWRVAIWAQLLFCRPQLRVTKSGSQRSS